MRAETMAALQNQHSALSFGIATLGLLVAAASLTWKDQPDAAGLIFLLAVPVASALVLVVWLAEHIRLVRLRIFLLELSQRINAELHDEGLYWEQWLVEATNARSFRPDLAKLQGYAVIPLFLLVATGSALLGAVTLDQSNSLSPVVAYGLFGFVFVLALAYLVGYLRLSARIREERERIRDRVTAIDILFVPDQSMLNQAKALNATLRGNLPSGFALDETHVPHVTLLQRYVRTDELDRVFAAVEDVIAAKPVTSLRLHAVKLNSLAVPGRPGLALATIVIEPTHALLDLQVAMMDAVAPFAESGGTVAAYVTTPDEPEINADTLVHVDEYVFNHSGEHYVPHITVGVAKEDFVKGLEAKPFEDFEFSPSALGVYQLGNYGTARRVLKSWALQPA